jgi:hypothetical protein
MSFGDRQARLRVMELVERRVKRFGSGEDLWPLRIPPDPVSLDDLIRQALPDGHGRFDVSTLRARTLLSMAWDDGTVWELWALVLPSGLKVFCDSGGGEHRILATGGRHSGAETDRLFLERLAESGGQQFGIEMAGGAPVTVRAFGIDRDRLVEFFLHLLEVTGSEGSVRAQLERAGVAVPHDAAGADFRHVVASWLDVAASNPGAAQDDRSRRAGPGEAQPLHFAGEADEDEYED